jgi:hypothetical protein
MNSKSRTIFVVIVDGRKTPNEIIQFGPISGLPPNEPVRRFLEPAIKHPMGLDGERVPNVSHGAFDEFRLFDYDCDPVRSDVTVAEVPEPGVLIVVRTPPAAAVDDKSDVPIQYVMKYQLEDSVPGKSFLSSAQARYRAAFPARYDIFLSYSSKDQGIGRELQERLRSNGLTCFLAENSIGSGSRFTEAIREAVQQSRILLLLLTPNSVRSQWVMCEVGAFWVLNRPIVPAYTYIDLSDLPDPIRENQARDISTTEAKERLVVELAAMRHSGSK